MTPSPAAGPDPEIAATCTAFSVIPTNLFNAQQGSALGSLSFDQYTAIMNTVPTDALVVSQMPGLRTELDGLVRAVDEQQGAANFDPNMPGFREAIQDIQEACKENGTPLVIQASGPGG